MGDDAETAIAGLLEQHQERWDYAHGERLGCTCGKVWGNLANLDPEYHHRAHVASVIAAHMAAPDELTALRERIRALADEWASRADEAYDYGIQLRKLLGATR